MLFGLYFIDLVSFCTYYYVNMLYFLQHGAKVAPLYDSLNTNLSKPLIKPRTKRTVMDGAWFPVIHCIVSSMENSARLDELVPFKWPEWTQKLGCGSEI